MKKKMDVGELRPGMYVAELDRPWLDSPFLFQGFFLDTEDEVAAVRKVCSFVFIDTDKVEGGDQGPAKGAGGKKSDLDTSLRQETAENGRDGEERKTFEAEFARARDIQTRLRELIYNMHFDARMGKTIEVATTRQVVRELVDSVLCNPDAQLWLTQLREKDEHMAEHSLAVAVFALAFGRHLGLAMEELLELGMGAVLHDIGKVKVPLSVINKPGELTPEELEIMRKHPEFGRELLQGLPGISGDIIGITLYHHESVRGDGYPDRLPRDRIPKYARIVGIADSYDAMTTRRTYRRQWSAADALKELYTQRGSRFDERLVEQFIQCLGIYPVGCLVELQSGEVGVVVSNHKSRRLKPKILLILNRSKQRITPPRVADLKTLSNGGAEGYVVKTVLGPDAYDINLSNYINVDQWFSN